MSTTSVTSRNDSHRGPGAGRAGPGRCAGSRRRSSALHPLPATMPAPCSTRRRPATSPCRRPRSSSTPSRAVRTARSRSPSCGPWAATAACPRSSTRTAAAGSSATSPPTSAWCATWPRRPAPRSSSSTTPRSPEAHYPVAIEQVYATVRWVAEHGAELGLDGSRLAVAGDSVGGNMTAAVTLLAKERGGPAIRYQALLYPVTNAAFDTDTYEQFAEGPWLTRKAMQWFWDAYAPRRLEAVRADGLAAAGNPGAAARACRRRWSSPTRRTCCATRARPTGASCARRASM